MKNKWLFLTVMVVLGAVASGCSHAPLSHDFGVVSGNNLNAQAINPNAGKGNVPMVTLDGAKGEHAMEAYRSDSGKAPVAAATSTSGSK